MHPASPDQIADRRHDERKTVDLNPLPFDAHTIATLARARTTSFEDAVRLIQQFADTTASFAEVAIMRKATHITGAALALPLTREAQS